MVLQSQTLKLSMVERGHQIDGRLLHVKLCTSPKIFPESESVHSSKVLQMKTKVYG